MKFNENSYNFREISSRFNIAKGQLDFTYFQFHQKWGPYRTVPLPVRQKIGTVFRYRTGTVTVTVRTSTDPVR